MFPRFLAVGEWKCPFLKSGRARFRRVKGKRPLSLVPVSTPLLSLSPLHVVDLALE